MEVHLLQASHNLSFIGSCTENHPDTYFDWKVTATFYTALHLIRALCVKRGVDPGRTHHDLANSLDPKRRTKKVTQIPSHIWIGYSTLQRYSEEARYDGFLDAEVENEIQRDNFEHAEAILEKLKDYFLKQGVVTT